MQRALGKSFLLLFVLLFTAGAFAQTLPSQLPPDTGTAGLKQTLRRLQTTGRLLQVTAHPDDEDGGMLTLEARGKGVTTTLLTLTRGEGGQNKVGSNLFDALGVLRTLELTASDKYYGVEQRFTRVADFGFSKNSVETFQKWGGHDVALADMVRVVRTFRPDVIIARFSGTPRDGHGNHEASGVLAQEAFGAAADPKRFPEQLKEGLAPWQAKKLYIGNVCGFGANTCPDENYTVKLNTGQVDPLLGKSYIQFALDGLRHQLSQGVGNFSVGPGDRFTFYKLVDSVLPPKSAKGEHEKDFLDGVDTTLPGLVDRLDTLNANQKTLWRNQLLQAQKSIAEAASTADREPASAITPLLSALNTVRKFQHELSQHPADGAAFQQVASVVNDKENQLLQAIDLAGGTSLNLVLDKPVDSKGENAAIVVPGQTFGLTARFASSEKLDLRKIALNLPPGWTSKQLKSTPSSNGTATEFEVTVPSDTRYTRPYWHRANPETDSVNQIDDPAYQTLPFAPAQIQARATYMLRGSQVHVDAIAMDKPGVDAWPVAVAPAFSVMLEPGQQVIPSENGTARSVTVAVSSSLPQEAQGSLRLEVPAQWRVEPQELPVILAVGEKRDFEFRVFPASLKEGRAQIRAVFTSGEKKYSEGYSVVTREDLDTAYYYQPAVQRISIADVKVPKSLKIGYIMGAGDEIPTVLKQLVMDVTLIPAEKLATEDLAAYGTIALGIRAYDTQKEVAANNKKLLDYVSSGGTLVVQYNAGVGDFNSGHFTPYSAQLGRTRVSVEEAPVEILAPADSIFHYPNQISAADFDGWVQERGLYFADQWDPQFTPLLASNDPGESPQKGGMLRASFGKGTYIYTGYAFFRQLPAGVPGAIRLFVNVLSAGHEAPAQSQ